MASHVVYRKTQGVALYDLCWSAMHNPELPITLAELTSEIENYASQFQHTYRHKANLLIIMLKQTSGFGVLTAEMALSLITSFILDADVVGSGSIGGYPRQGSKFTSALYSATGLSYLVK